MTINIANGTIYRQPDGTSALTQYVAPPELSYGQLWPDGVEPVDSGYFPLTAGKRNWYVDAAAPDGGDGSESAPFNSFEFLIGWWSGATQGAAGTYTQGGSSFSGGDHILLTGTFSASNHVNGTKNMDINMRRASQFGTAAAPTVIRSWPGRSRAVFDGEYTDRITIYAGLTSGTTAGLVVLNVEVKRSIELGIYIDDYIFYYRVYSNYIHHNYALVSGPLDSYGGIKIPARRNGVDGEAFYNKTERNNTTDGVDYQIGASNNIGGIAVLGNNVGTDASTSTVKVMYNEILDEAYSIRHKHTANYTFISRYNYINAARRGHYLRCFGVNTVEDNIVLNCTDGDAILEAENQTGRRTVNYRRNTLTNVTRAIATASTAETLGNDVVWEDNDYTNSSYTGPVIVMGDFGSSGSSLADVSGGGNIIRKNGTDFAEENGTIVNLATYSSTTGDTTTTQVSP